MYIYEYVSKFYQNKHVMYMNIFYALMYIISTNNIYKQQYKNINNIFNFLTITMVFLKYIHVRLIHQEQLYFL